MKSLSKLSFLKMLVLVLGLIGGAELPAHAQSAVGTFTLAHKVRWGTAVLPAGDYKFSLDTVNWPARVTVRELGGPVIAIVLPNVLSDKRTLTSSNMILREAGGESFVSKLQLAAVGLELEYSAPKLEAATETATLGPGDSQPAK